MISHVASSFFSNFLYQISFLPPKKCVYSNEKEEEMGMRNVLCDREIDFHHLP